MRITITEYYKGVCQSHKHTTYFQDSHGDVKFIRNRRLDSGLENLDPPYFSVEGEPLEAYYEVREFV